MTRKEQEKAPSITPSDQALVLSSLEPEQLAGLRKHVLPRLRLTSFQKLVVWSLRAYLLFMMAVVVYQIWHGLH